MVLFTLLPYMSCGQHIELSRVWHLEQSAIRRFPNALNKCRHPASSPRVTRSSASLSKKVKDAAKKVAQQGCCDSRVDTTVSYVNSADATVPATTHLINTAMDTSRFWVEKGAWKRRKKTCRVF